MLKPSFVRPALPQARLSGDATKKRARHNAPLDVTTQEVPLLDKIRVVVRVDDPGLVEFKNHQRLTERQPILAELCAVAACA